MSDFHEGDMLEELVEYYLHNVSVREIIDIVGGNMSLSESMDTS